MTLGASKVSQALIKPQLAMMKQGDSPENKAQLEIERQHTLGRLRAARQKALAKSAIPCKDTASGFPAHRDQLAAQIQEPAKEKTKTPRRSFRIGKLACRVRCSFHKARHRRRSRREREIATSAFYSQAKFDCVSSDCADVSRSKQDHRGGGKGHCLA